MNSKYKTKKNVSKKPIIFWSIIGALVLILVIMLIVRIAKTKEVSSYGRLDMITGQQMFNQDENNYLVLFYNFNGEKQYEEFDKGMYRYLTYVRDNAKATAIFGMDTDANQNRICFVSNQASESISGATQFPNAYNSGESGVLHVYEDNCPILFIFTDGKLSAYKSGENAVLAYLKDAMK